MYIQCDRGRTGMRGITSASLLVKDLADNFEGLQKGVRKGSVLSAFKRAAVVLDISPRHVFAIDKLMGFSYEQDWENHQRPIVWPSNERLQEELGLSRRMVQYTIRQLIDLKLISPVDSPTGKRYGHRDHRGYITEAYGFDLSPVAVRYEEFVSVAEQAEIIRKERSKLRRQITVTKKAILQITAVAIEDELDGGEWEVWAEEALDITSRVPSCLMPEQLQPLLNALLERKKIAEDALRLAVLSVDNLVNVEDKQDLTEHNISPEGAMDCTHNTTTKQLKFNKLNTFVDKQKEPPEKSRDMVARWERKNQDLDAQITVHDAMDKYKITPKLISYVCPDFEAGLFSDNPGWNDILSIADHYKTSLNIPQTIWGEACRVLGRQGASVAMAIVTAKRHELKSPGGYFRGMVNKARTGQLNLGPTIYALRDVRDSRKAQKNTDIQDQDQALIRTSTSQEKLANYNYANKAGTFKSIGTLTNRFKRRN